MNMRFIQICAILTVACALTGCSTGPDLKAQNAQLIIQNTELSSQLTHCNEGQTSLQAVLAQCEGTQVGLQAKLNQCSDYNQNLQTRCDQAAAILVQANSRIRDLAGQADAATQAAADAQNRYTEAARSAQALKVQVEQNADALNNANQQLNVTRATLQKTMAEAAASRDKANQQLAELSRQIAALQARVGRQGALPRPAQPAGGRVASVREDRESGLIPVHSQGVPTAPDLPRRIGFWGASAIMVGVTIGTGIFRTPGDIAKHTASPGLVLALWAVGGLLSLCGALTYAEMAAMHPQTGGVYVFLRLGLGRAVAFTFGWTYMLISKPFAAAGIAVIFGENLLLLFNVELPDDRKAFAVNAITTVTLVVLTLINVRGVTQSTGLAKVLTGLKVAALLAITAVALALPGGAAANLKAGVSTEPFSVAIAPIMLSVLWTYDGWSDVGSIAGEVQNPQRQLPRIYLTGTAAITILYLAANAAYLWVVPLATQSGHPSVAALAMQRVLGAAGAAAVTVIVAVSSLGASHASVLTGARVTFAQSRDGLLFRFLSRIHPRYQTPAVSLWFQLGMSIAALWYAGSFRALANGFTFTMWIFYGLAACSIFILRIREPQTPRPYRCWGYPLTPAVFIAASAAMTALTIYGDLTDPKSHGTQTLPWIGVLLAGLPIYFVWRWIVGPDPEAAASR